MDLSTGQQRAIFAAVVIGLAGLGLYLIGPSLRHDGATASGKPTATPNAAPSAPPVTTAPPAPVPSTGGQAVNIYQWLPFTQQELGAAAAVTTRFCAAYETFSYTESAAAYAAHLDGLASGQLAGLLRASYATLGVAKQRSSQRQVSAGTGTIESLRAFGQSSLTFVVSITQQLTTTTGKSAKTVTYAITVVQSVNGWQVNDIELAQAGNT